MGRGGRGVSPFQPHPLHEGPGGSWEATGRRSTQLELGGLLLDGMGDVPVYLPHLV